MVKLQSSLTVQSKIVGLGVDFVFPPSEEQQEPPTEIYQIEVHYRLEILHWDSTHEIKTRWQLPWMVSHHSQDGHPP